MRDMFVVSVELPDKKNIVFDNGTTKEAIKNGIIPPPTKCEWCSQTKGMIDYHNETYKSPVEGLIPLCMLCHLMWHSRFLYRVQWEWYEGQIKEVRRFEPIQATYLFALLKNKELSKLKHIKE